MRSVLRSLLQLLAQEAANFGHRNEFFVVITDKDALVLGNVIVGLHRAVVTEDRGLTAL